jgi:hypothetical protein
MTRMSLSVVLLVGSLSSLHRANSIGVDLFFFLPSFFSNADGYLSYVC